MKKFIQISNTGSAIRVTGGLQSVNATNYNSPAADRLNVKPAWSKLSVVIETGIHWYPAELKTWNTVKALVEAEIFTIGSEADTCPDQDRVEALARQLSTAHKRYDEECALVSRDTRTAEKPVVKKAVKEVVEETEVDEQPNLFDEDK